MRTIALCALVVCGAAAFAAGADGANGANGNWLQSLASAAATQASQPTKEPATKEAEWEKPIPLTLNVEYTLVSDYIWRGVNLSEYRGEGAERPNHQLNLAASYDTGKFGSFNLGVWFEWYAGQFALTPDGNNHLQEVDYTASWKYTVEPLATTVEIGWLSYQFPQLHGDPQNTTEWFIKLGYDDSKLFGTENAVLNPTVAYYMDVDDVKGGQWIDFGISHDFVLADMGCADTPFLKYVTITPSATLGVNHRYWVKTTQLATLVYGLAIGYDLSSALNIPKKYGSVGLKGFINYSEALALKDEVPEFRDVLYGGMSLGWEW